MDSAGVRNNRNKSGSRNELSIERFAYDVFSYMLPLCGFPENAISSTNIAQNVYCNKDFVKKTGLLVLTVAMQMRDLSKSMFELKHMLIGFNSLRIIQDYLIGVVQKNEHFRVADEVTKVQVSLALYNEMMLFFDYKGLETHVDQLLNSWSKFYLQYIAEDQHIEMVLQSSLECPEVFENTEQIVGFIKKYAVPYGHSNNVSTLYSKYFIKKEDPESSPFKKTSTRRPDESVAEMSGIASKKSAPYLEGSDTAMPLPGNREFSDPSESPPTLQKNISSKGNACGKQSTDVLESNPEVHERKTCLEQDLKDVFEEMYLDTEHVHQECESVKFKKNRQLTISFI